MNVNIEDLEYQKLKGKYKHYCYDWDDMAIDETCPEFESCLCFTNNEEVERLKNEIQSHNS